MAWYTNLLSVGIDKVITAAGGVLDELFTSEDERQKNKQAMKRIRDAADQAKSQAYIGLEKAYMDDANKLRKHIEVEIQSQDPYVRRSRPTFNYIFYAFLIFNYLLIPAVYIGQGLVTGKHVVWSSSCAIDTDRSSTPPNASIAGTSHSDNAPKTPGTIRVPHLKLPDQLWWVFGVGFVGYGYFRTVEKTGERLPIPHTKRV